MKKGEKVVLKGRLKLKIILLNRTITNIEKKYKVINADRVSSHLFDLNMEKEVRKIKCIADSILMLNEPEILFIKKRGYK